MEYSLLGREESGWKRARIGLLLTLRPKVGTPALTQEQLWALTSCLRAGERGKDFWVPQSG